MVLEREFENVSRKIMSYTSTQGLVICVNQ